MKYYTHLWSTCYRPRIPVMPKLRIHSGLSCMVPLPGLSKLWLCLVPRQRDAILFSWPPKPLVRAVTATAGLFLVTQRHGELKHEQHYNLLFAAWAFERR